MELKEDRLQLIQIELIISIKTHILKKEVSFCTMVILLILYQLLD